MFVTGNDAPDPPNAKHLLAVGKADDRLPIETIRLYRGLRRPDLEGPGGGSRGGGQFCGSWPRQVRRVEGRFEHSSLNAHTAATTAMDDEEQRAHGYRARRRRATAGQGTRQRRGPMMSPFDAILGDQMRG